MSTKTDQLVASLPDAYAADDASSICYLLLDAIGAEFVAADATIKRLLKSHWVDYAQAGGLDALGATFGVQRRRLPGGATEDDDRFRRRLKSVVVLFTGGGTVEAVKGAVRSALGLPFHLGLANLPSALRDDLDRLVALQEFSPTPELLVFDAIVAAGDVSELSFDVASRSALEAQPRIAWTFMGTSAHALSVDRLGADGGGGLRSKPSLVVPAGGVLILSTTPAGAFSAVLDGVDVSTSFSGLAAADPPMLPRVPREPSSWSFRAAGAAFDDSTFDDGETFDLPRFSVELGWTRTQPLTFDVVVPYFLQAAVDALVKRHQYSDEIFAFEGLPREVIQQVVDGARAAGVRASVHFSLSFAEDQHPQDALRLDGARRFDEAHGARDAFAIGSVSTATEQHSASEAFALGAEFDIATFDGPFGTV